MNLAKLSTTKTFLVGPILDSSGAAKTDEVVASIKVTKNGTVGAVDAQDTLTHNHTGHYVFVSDGGDFDTLGEVEFSLNSGTNAMAPIKFQVVPATVYDAITALAMGAALGFASVAAGGAKLAQTVDLTAGQTIAATVAGGATEAKQDTAKTVIDIIAADTTTDIPALIDALPTATEIKTAIEAAGSHLTLILEDTGMTIPGTITTLQGNVTTIMADTDLLDDAVGGIVDIHTDVAAVKAETAELKAAVITNATGVDIAADIIALKAETVLIVADTGELQTNQGNWLTATGFATPTNITAASGVTLAASQHVIVDSGSVTVSDKTGFSLASTGADLILKSSTFIQAIAAALNELATYGLTAINTLLVTTGIKTAATAAPTDMALNSTVAKDATVSKPETAQTITAPADMALNSTVAKTAEITALDAVVDTVKVDTAAVKVQTDKLVFTVANQVDANVQSVNDVLLAGNGTTTPMGAA